MTAQLFTYGQGQRNLSGQYIGIGHQQAQQCVYNEPSRHRRMAATDLGIIDELLDDKIGMEP